MELVIILVVVVAIFIISKSLKFSNFKSQLIHALAELGLSYEKANDLYTENAKLVGKMHADGLTPADIASRIYEAKQAQQDEWLMERIKVVYGVSGDLAESLASNPPPNPDGIIGTFEFVCELLDFVDTLKKNLGVEIEEQSLGRRILQSFANADYDSTLQNHVSVISTLHQLSSRDDRAGYIFHMFWPTLHTGLAKGSACSSSQG